MSYEVFKKASAKLRFRDNWKTELGHWSFWFKHMKSKFWIFDFLNVSELQQFYENQTFSIENCCRPGFLHKSTISVLVVLLLNSLNCFQILDCNREIKIFIVTDCVDAQKKLKIWELLCFFLQLSKLQCRKIV